MLPVVPLCEKQLRDVRPQDVVYLQGDDTIPGREDRIPIARVCNIESAGGGYDMFRLNYLKRFGRDTGPVHFIVQLYGCTQECPWCYVTPEGVWGEPVMVPYDTLMKYALYASANAGPLGESEEKGVPVFHLMGGAPALHLHLWPCLMKALARTNLVFHSDFLLDEGLYPAGLMDILGSHRRGSQLHAVSFKPMKPLTRLQLHNLKVLVDANVPFYITFTGMTEEMIQARKKQVLDAGFSESIFDGSFVIPLKHYKSLD